MPPQQNLFDHALDAARAGRRKRALDLLKEYLEQDKTNPKAWFLLSELVDNPRAKTAFLENALKLSPPGSRMERDIKTRLSALRAPAASPAAGQPAAAAISAPLEPSGLSAPQAHLSAEQLLNAGRQEEAAALLMKTLEKHPKDTRALWLLSEASTDPAVRLNALERLLEIEPGNVEAARRREQLATLNQDPLERGLHLEAQGKVDEAIAVYLSVIAHSRLPSERVEANRRIADLRLRQEAESIQPVNPTVNLLRLTAGPAVLFLLMIFLQSGLNLLHIPLLAIPGFVSVLAGSLLVSATEMRPAHPYWIALFGQPGTGDEPDMRRGLRLLGLALLLAPYALFLIEAGLRLGELQAAMLANN